MDNHTPTAPPEILGRTAPICKVRSMIALIAPSAIPVLIRGETGTGKELVAQFLHRQSGRRRMVVVNCAALPGHLLESEMFGHVKGAFTGAHKDKLGLLAEADGGTVFLDEIGDMPLDIQPKLLRALDDGEIRPVGATKKQTVNIRILAATNKLLVEEIEQGRFREDLYARLDGAQIEMPPLRERLPDVPILARHFLENRAISSEAIRYLSEYQWPWNVRELRSTLEYAMAVASTHLIQAHDLPEKIRNRSFDPKSGNTRLQTLEAVVCSHIAHVLEKVGGNQSTAARILGIDRGTIRRKMRQRADQTGL